ncbi:hypothetical protein ACFL96_19030 [Thermoproteota archaeon]
MKLAKPTALVLVIDAVGISTLEYLLENNHDMLEFPNLSKMGLGSLLNPKHYNRFRLSDGNSRAMKVVQASAAADSVVGHREMMGVIDPREYELFHKGFPPGYIGELERMIRRKTMFNQMAGGIETIEKNYEEHEQTGMPIVYASKCDPLIQIAMNEDMIPVKEQHDIVEKAFELAQMIDLPITRAIARSYVRKEGEIIRTANRHDVVLPLEQRTLLDILDDRGVYTVSVGKIADLVPAQYGDCIKYTEKGKVDPAFGMKFVHPDEKDTNPMVFQGVIDSLIYADQIFKDEGTFIFANLVDTDSLYGHTRDIDGALRSIQETDRVLSLIENNMRIGDLLIITADHGMEHRKDYGYHSIEPLPILARRVGVAGLRGVGPGNCRTLADVGYLVSQMFGCQDQFVEECGLKEYF